MDKWSDTTILKTIKNPSTMKYEMVHETPEFTFLGAGNKPDFAHLKITMVPQDVVIELKSLKFYLYQFREKIVSYERLINVIYSDLMDVYNPVYLMVEFVTTPRGGINSHLKIDSNNNIKKYFK